MTQQFDRNKIASFYKKGQILLCVKKENKYDSPSFWTGNGESFSVLHGCHNITKEEDGYYNHYHEKPKLIAKFEDTETISAKAFWQLADLDSIPKEMIEDVRKNMSYASELRDNYEYIISHDDLIISHLLNDLLERDSFSRKVLI